VDASNYAHGIQRPIGHQHNTAIYQPNVQCATNKVSQFAPRNIEVCMLILHDVIIKKKLMRILGKQIPYSTRNEHTQRRINSNMSNELAKSN
jgi:hypothetical protein